MWLCFNFELMTLQTSLRQSYSISNLFFPREIANKIHQLFIHVYACSVFYDNKHTCCQLKDVAWLFLQFICIDENSFSESAAVEKHVKRNILFPVEGGKCEKFWKLFPQLHIVFHKNSWGNTHSKQWWQLTHWVTCSNMLDHGLVNYKNQQCSSCEIHITFSQLLEKDLGTDCYLFRNQITISQSP